MKRISGTRIVAVAAILAAVAGGALSTSASAATRPANAPSAASAAADTEFCFYTPRGAISHYFSLATGTRVVKGHYNHGDTFAISKPPHTTGQDGITYWKLPNGFWIDSAGIMLSTKVCES